jgi:hypothetical protein
MRSGRGRRRSAAAEIRPTAPRHHEQQPSQHLNARLRLAALDRGDPGLGRAGAQRERPLRTMTLAPATIGSRIG